MSSRFTRGSVAVHYPPMRLRTSLDAGQVRVQLAALQSSRGEGTEVLEYRVVSAILEMAVL